MATVTFKETGLKQEVRVEQTQHGIKVYYGELLVATLEAYEGIDELIVYGDVKSDEFSAKHILG